MKREPVDSSSIISVGYDPNWKMLEVEFRESGEVYLYFEVPQSEYKAFMSAPSKRHLSELAIQESWIPLRTS